MRLVMAYAYDGVPMQSASSEAFPTPGSLDQSRINQLLERLFAALNGSALAVFVSIGHKSGLIKTMLQMTPATSAEIAQAAGLNERYVREWLGGMVVCGIVDYAPDRSTYALPPEHAVVLTGNAGPNVLAQHAEYIPILAGVEPYLLECFRSGGGPAPEVYGFSTLVPVNNSGTDADLLRNAIEIAPGLPESLRDGIDAADFGCGRGHFVNVMARAFPNSRFTGYDFGDENIQIARAETEGWGLKNARFELQDLADLDVSSAFDLITTIDVIHDLAKPRAVLATIYRSLRQGGTYLMGDVQGSTNIHENIGQPLAPYAFLWSLAGCMPASLRQGGEGLGAMWGEQKALEFLGNAGFHDIAVVKPTDDLINCYYICRKN
jgi:2-polyprenyl-3-methyl-5-hydroxy-6-metoxy-1,4-benzoquinol methylase